MPRVLGVIQHLDVPAGVQAEKHSSREKVHIVLGRVSTLSCNELEKRSVRSVATLWCGQNNENCVRTVYVCDKV